ncbi:MAG: hypothetical protein J0I47_03310 [Sphingomonas sp.]|uniref:hypothetical protein n=1 Tax=Sphingomonas sp. TaxID=28214 RepID=UPI001AC6177F|nr:hypothetical protein [Sphingomonas sp.]MBN8807255.1 hypothetical protein [Sphingomonas sp.]
MTDPTPDVAAAQAKADLARRRLLSTAATLKERLSPGSLARTATEKLKDTGTGLARSSVETVKEHPLPAIGVVAAIAAFFTRKPLARLFGRGKAKPDPIRSRRK